MNAGNGYLVDVFYSERDGCYVANIPDLRYCSAFGDTADDAMNEVLIARDLYLESCERHGDPIPETMERHGKNRVDDE